MPIDKAAWEACIRFGMELIETEDLDPMYVSLWKSELRGRKLRRWLLAYFFSYHAGVASKIADAKEFWPEVWKFQNEKWPRGTERRHFRGKASEKAIKWFENQYDRPEDAIKLLETFDDDTFVNLKEYLQGNWPLFGPWIAFKIADILERLEIANISFSIDNLSFYDSPAKASEIVNPGGTPQETVELLIEQFKTRTIKDFEPITAPPRYERPCGIQEIETCLCKFGSFTKGHYTVGKDIYEIREALKGWGTTAEALRKCLPKRVKAV